MSVTNGQIKAMMTRSGEKYRILREQLGTWLKDEGNQVSNEIFVWDCCAYQGLIEDDSQAYSDSPFIRAGSPFEIINTVSNSMIHARRKDGIWYKRGGPNIHICLVERDRESFQMLQAAIDNCKSEGDLPDRISIHCVLGDYREIVLDWIYSHKVIGKNIPPAFYFVDPCGYREINRGLTLAMIEGGGTVLQTMMTRDLLRHLKIDNFKGSITSVLGERPAPVLSHLEVLEEFEREISVNEDEVPSRVNLLASYLSESFGMGFGKILGAIPADQPCYHLMRFDPFIPAFVQGDKFFSAFDTKLPVTFTNAEVEFILDEK